MDIRNYKKLNRLMRKIVVCITVIVFATTTQMSSNQVEYVYAASEAIQNLEDPSAADNVMGSKMTTANSTTPDTIRIVNTTLAYELPTLTYQPQSTVGTPLEITYTGGDESWIDVFYSVSVTNQTLHTSLTLQPDIDYKINKSTQTITFKPHVLTAGYNQIIIKASSFNYAYVGHRVELYNPPALTADETKNDTVTPLEISYSEDVNGWTDMIEYISAYNVSNNSNIEIHYPNFEIDKNNRIIKINSGILPLGYYTITIHATNFKNADVMQKVNEPMPPKLTADTTDNYGDQPIEITFPNDGEWAQAITEITVKWFDSVIIPLSKSDYTVDAANGKIIINPDVIQHVGLDYTIEIKATNYSVATLKYQEIKAYDPPKLVADSTDRYSTMPIELTFVDDGRWAQLITGMKVNGQPVSNSEYTVDGASGKITINPGVLTAGQMNGVEVLAEYYRASGVFQVIDATKIPPTVNPDTSETYLLNPLELSFTPDNEWADAISQITVQEQTKGINFTLPKENYEVNKTAHTITIVPGTFNEIGYYKITISAAGYSDAYFWQNVSLKTPPHIKADTTNNEYSKLLELPYTDDGLWSDAITSIRATNPKTGEITALSASDYTVDKLNGKITINPGVLPIGEYSIRIVAPNYIDAQVYQIVKEISSILLTADTTENDAVHDLELTFTDDGNWAKSNRRWILDRCHNIS